MVSLIMYVKGRDQMATRQQRLTDDVIAEVYARLGIATQAERDALKPWSPPNIPVQGAVPRVLLTSRLSDTTVAAGSEGATHAQLEKPTG